MAASLGKTLILCGGLQSGGTTLVSYSFLQRGDTDGVLDADNDLLPALDPRLARPFAWYKTTISCFRLSEIAQHYRDDGWEVRPLLVLRDLRAAWSSLCRKEYGRNGITAEDPPLRLRVRRFVEDWRSFKNGGSQRDDSPAAVMRYEDLIAAPQETLQRVCQQLELPWDPAMVRWPKPPQQIAHRNNGNGSFWATLAGGLVETIARYEQTPSMLRLTRDDLAWLESEFHEFNESNGYPQHINSCCEQSISTQHRTAPSFAVTRRYIWETSRKPFRWLLAQLGRPNQKLIDQRSWKRAA